MKAHLHSWEFLGISRNSQEFLGIPRKLGIHFARVVALDWLRIVRNLGNLSKVCLPFLLACVYIYIC